MGVVQCGKNSLVTRVRFSLLPFDVLFFVLALDTIRYSVCTLYTMAAASRFLAADSRNMSCKHMEAGYSWVAEFHFSMRSTDSARLVLASSDSMQSIACFSCCFWKEGGGEQEQNAQVQNKVQSE